MNFNKKLAVAVSGAVLLMAGQFALADSTTDIVDALVSKGVLTEEEGKLISKGHETKKKADGTVAFKDGFKINSGDGKSNISLNGRIMLDYRNFDVPSTNPTNTAGANVADTFDIRRAYMSIKGSFRNLVNFEVTTDVGASKYFWLEGVLSEKAKVRFGQFKMPGGLEQLTSSRFIDFTERDFVSNLMPAVNRGVMLHGVPTTGVTYAVSVSNGGYFADSGATVNELGSGSDGKAYNGRLTVNIAELMGNKEAIAHLGGSYGYDSNLPTEATKVQRSNARGTTFFSSASSLTNPDITRYGLEAIVSKGPVKFQGEYANMSFETSTAGEVERDIKASYAGVAWMITGETYASAYKNGIFDRMRPNKDFTGIDGSGWGAWEIGARYSKYDAKDFAVTATSTNDVDSYSAGIKWIADPNTRFLADYIYTDFNKDITAAGTFPINASNEKAINLRAQFDF